MNGRLSAINTQRRVVEIRDLLTANRYVAIPFKRERYAQGIKTENPANPCKHWFKRGFLGKIV